MALLGHNTVKLKDPVKKTRRERRKREDVTVWVTENGFEGMFENQAGFNR